MDLETTYAPDNGRDTDGRAAAAFAKIVRSVHREGPSGQLAGSSLRKGRPVEEQLRKAAPSNKRLAEDIAEALVNAGVPVRAGRLAANGIGEGSVAALAKILSRTARRGLGLPPEGFAPSLKKGQAPQSSNATWDSVRGDDGAQLSQDAVEGERQAAGTRPTKAPPFLGNGSAPHAASVAQARTPATQEDGTFKSNAARALDAIKQAQRHPRALVPGALRGDAQNTNRADAVQ